MSDSSQPPIGVQRTRHIYRLVLGDYERDALLWLLETVRSGVGDFNLANTGDWVFMLINELDPATPHGHAPLSVDDLRQPDVERMRGELYDLRYRCAVLRQTMERLNKHMRAVNEDLQEALAT